MAQTQQTSPGPSKPHIPGGETPPAIELCNFSAGYGEKTVVSGVSYTAPPGSITAIIGPNGAGKSTLLKGMLGLLEQARSTTGRRNKRATQHRPKEAPGLSVRYLSQPLSRVRSQVAYMPQTESVDWDFPATALDVAKFGVSARSGWIRATFSAGERENQALQALAQVGLAEQANTSIGELSGGQRKRLFLARALAQQPQILLLDEPYAGVDVVSQREITATLLALAASGRTVVLVHHDLAAVREFCDAAILLGYGRVASGKVPEVFSSGLVAEVFGASEDEVLT